MSRARPPPTAPGRRRELHIERSRPDHVRAGQLFGCPRRVIARPALGLPAAMIRFDSPGSRALLASVLDAIIAVDASGRVVEWNPAAERVFGYTRNDAIGGSITGLIIPPESRSHYEAVLESIRQTGASSIFDICAAGSSLAGSP